MILLFDVLACDPKWQSQVCLGPFSRFIFVLNIAQSRLVNVCTRIYRWAFKYKFGRALLWMFSYNQHNHLFSLYAKVVSFMFCSTSLHVHLSLKVRQFQILVKSSNQRYIWPLERAKVFLKFHSHASEFTDSGTFLPLRGHSLSPKFKYTF